MFAIANESAIGIRIDAIDALLVNLLKKIRKFQNYLIEYLFTSVPTKPNNNRTNNPSISCLGKMYPKIN